MLTTSSSNSNDTSTTDVSTHSSKAEVLQALQTAWKSYFQSARCVQFFLSIILSTHVLFPHKVTKCSQLGLILLVTKRMMPPTFIEISESLLTCLTSLCPLFKIAPASRTTLQMIKCPSHLNLPSPCFTLVISVVQPPWMLLHSGQGVALGPLSTPPIMSSGPSCCSMTRLFNGPMQMRNKKHLTGWRASLVTLGDLVTAWSMAHSSLSHLNLDTLESNYSITSLIIPSVLW